MLMGVFLNAYTTSGAVIPAKSTVPIYDSNGDLVTDGISVEIYLDQMPDKLPDTVDNSLATLGYYQDEMTIGDVKGEIFYFTSNGIVNSLLWTTKEVDETSINNVLEELRERYGEESAFDQERNSYSWSEGEESSIWAAIDGEELKINWISLL